eukprot:7911006-Pyramimonas_sp.AAC.2
MEFRRKSAGGGGGGGRRRQRRHGGQDALHIVHAVWHYRQLYSTVPVNFKIDVTDIDAHHIGQR